MTPTRPDWRRTAAAVRAARIEAGYRNQEEAADAAGVGVTTWRLIEGGKRDYYTPATAFAVTRLFGWPSDTLERIANGDPAPPVLAEVAPVDQLAALEDRIARLERHHTEMEGFMRLMLERLGAQGLAGQELPAPPNANPTPPIAALVQRRVR